MTLNRLKKELSLIEGNPDVFVAINADTPDEFLSKIESVENTHEGVKIIFEEQN